MTRKKLHTNLSVDKEKLHVVWKFVCRQGKVTDNMEIVYGDKKKLCVDLSWQGNVTCKFVSR